MHEWSQLPDCKPEYIEASRYFKSVLTGNLNAEVKSQPPFPGMERHLLRAMIARIFHGTSIAPKGLLEIDEETKECKVSEEFVMPPPDELKQLESWGNLYPNILKNGRISHLAPVEMDEAEADEWRAAQDELDKVEERFRPINEHIGMPGTAPVPEEEKAWVSKIAGDQQ